MADIEAEEGDILKDFLYTSRLSAPAMAKVLGVSSTAIYHQLGLKKLSNSFVEKLNSKDIYIVGINSKQIAIPL